MRLSQSVILLLLMRRKCILFAGYHIHIIIKTCYTFNPIVLSRLTLDLQKFVKFVRIGHEDMYWKRIISHYYILF